MSRGKVATCLNGRLHDEGFTVAAIAESDLARVLADQAVSVAEGRYRDVKIIPTDIAFDGSGYKTERPGHVFYVVVDKDHPSYDNSAIHLPARVELVEEGPFDVDCIR
jgi:hypothetical protein